MSLLTRRFQHFLDEALFPQSGAGLPPIRTWHQWNSLSPDVFPHRCFTTVTGESMSKHRLRGDDCVIHSQPARQSHRLVSRCLVAAEQLPLTPPVSLGGGRFVFCPRMFAQMIGRMRHCQRGHCSTPPQPKALWDLSYISFLLLLFFSCNPDFSTQKSCNFYFLSPGSGRSGIELWSCGSCVRSSSR